MIELDYIRGGIIMPIPDEILAVKRPKNTVVIVYGKNKDHYAVRKRVGCKNVDGRHVPINGPTIGHIINGIYVPLDSKSKEKVSSSLVDLKNWANVILCDNLFQDIKKELLEIYHYSDAMKIYCISILRVLDPGIKNNELKDAYDDSFLSELYPDVALSKNTISKFLNDLGKALSKIIMFMRRRADNVSLDHHLLVDGTLKSNDSKINSLSDFSRKARIKGSRDISVLYAFDLENMEPICSKCFPGNMLDSRAYEAFIEENGITKGIIVGDKGFPEKEAHAHFEANKDLHYLNPVKRNSLLAKRHSMYDFIDILDGYEGITYRKEKCSGTNKWLYSFRDSKAAAQEEQEWLIKAKKEGTYSLENLRMKQNTFGTIVLECDLDMPAEIAYKAYESRWMIEIVMRYYKSACEFDETRVHDDYSVIGSEFCDFLSTILTFKLLKEFDKRHLLEHYTYKKLMAILTRAKKIKVDNDDWKLIRLNKSHMDILMALNLIPNTKNNIVEKRRRGRPSRAI